MWCTRKEEKKEETIDADELHLQNTHKSIIRTFDITTSRYAKILKQIQVHKMVTLTLFYGSLIDSAKSIPDMQKILTDWKTEVCEKICFNEANHVQTE
jgi:hypothetical protein